MYNCLTCGARSRNEYCYKHNQDSIQRHNLSKFAYNNSPEGKAKAKERYQRWYERKTAAAN